MAGYVDTGLGAIVVAVAAEAKPALLVVARELVVACLLVVTAVVLQLAIVVIATTLVMAAAVLFITTILLDVFVFPTVVAGQVCFAVKLTTAVLASLETEAVVCGFIIDTKSPTRTRKFSPLEMYLLYGGDASGVTDVEVETELVVAVGDVLCRFSEVTVTVANPAEADALAPEDVTAGRFVSILTST